jgi:diguanylate cyclase (GGDEF)-like protein
MTLNTTKPATGPLVNSPEAADCANRRAAGLGKFRSYVNQHRVTIQDLSVLLAVMLVGTFLVFEFDIYANQDGITRHEQTIELDEALSLGGILCIGLLIFSMRRYREQKRETRRRVVAEQHARDLAFQDPLTGLANRRQFDEALKAALAAPPGAGGTHAILLLDLNGFKQVNDLHGHGIGDELLTIVAQRLATAVRTGDLVARLGGDEFAVLSQHLMGAEAATSIAMRILHALEDPISAGHCNHQIGSGIGIALIPGDATTLQEALRKADVALYRAKSERRSALRFFEEEMDRHVQERDRLDHDLRAAITADMIQPFFQPVVDLKTKNVLGFEAIPRWIDASLGEISLDRFIPVAEENGLIHELFERLLKQACAAAATWPSTVTLALDIFPSQLKDRTLHAMIMSVLEASGVVPGRLELEITESALVRDLEGAREILGSLRKSGVKIVLDNFGTGYSSLYHLRNFKLDKIKIDRSFIETLGSQESAEIVNALVGLGHGLGLTIVADGVAGSEQRASLLTTGCEQGQGFFFSRAVPVEDTLTFFPRQMPDADGSLLSLKQALGGSSPSRMSR